MEITKQQQKKPCGTRVIAFKMWNRPNEQSIAHGHRKHDHSIQQAQSSIDGHGYAKSAVFMIDMHIHVCLNGSWIAVTFVLLQFKWFESACYCKGDWHDIYCYGTVEMVCV